MPTLPKNCTKTNKLSRLKIKFLNFWHNNPTRDFQTIFIIGNKSKIEIAHFIEKILLQDNKKISVIAANNDINLGYLFNFFSKSWKSGANYVVVTANLTSQTLDLLSVIKADFLALTDTNNSTSDTTDNLTLENTDNFNPKNPKNTSDSSDTTKIFSPKTQKTLSIEDCLQNLSANHIIFNADNDKYFELKKLMSENFHSYGKDSSADAKITAVKSYKKGTEATISVKNTNYPVATFSVEKEAVSSMACATTIAALIGTSKESIISGIADYLPETPENQ